MNLKVNKITLIFLVTLIIIFICYFLYYIQEKNLVVKSSVNPVLVPVKEALLDLQEENNFQQLSKKQQQEQVHTLLEDMPSEYKALKRQYQIALSTLPNITFYGRVVDQYDQPVAEATIYYTGTNTYLSAGGGRGKVETDEQGYFEIDTEGAQLVLGGVGHPEIGVVSYEPPNFANNTTWGGVHYTKVNFLSARDKQGIYPTWRDHTEKDHAYIIRAWRLGEYEGAKTGRISIGLPSVGSVYTIKLNEAKRKNRVIKGQKEGDFHISCIRPHIESYKDHLDWSASIVPVNGGIQETDDMYMNIAPETGYQSSIDIVMHKGSKDYAPSLLNKRYFFTINNGKKSYGSLFVHFKPFASIEEDACSISIRYKINSTGSRSLELKREDTSQPHLPSSKQLASN